MLPFTYLVTLRYLRFKGKKSFISLITVISITGVAVGVMTLMVVMSVMSGFEQELKDKFLGVYGHVVVSSDRPLFDYLPLIERVEKLPRVKAVAPFVAGQVIIRTYNRALGVNLRGIDPAREARVTDLERYLVAGNLNPAEDEIIIGEQLALLSGLELGDTVILISPTEVLLPGGGTKRERFRVGGIFKSGMAQYDLELAYVSIPAAQRLFGLDEGISGLSLKLDNVDYAHLVRKELETFLPYPPYHVRSWMELNKPLFTAIQVEKNLMFIIVTLIIVVASFNIASTLIVTVKEKTKAIGVLKAIGAPDSTIRKIFTYQGLLIGLTGALLGIAAGLLLIANINHVQSFLTYRFGMEVFPPEVYYFDRIPARADIRETLIIALSALTISVLASLYPAWQASRLEPVTALRYE